MTNPIISVSTDEEYKEAMKPHADSIVALNFYATWAPQCEVMNAVFEELAVKFNKSMIFVKVDAEGASEISEQFDIIAVPTFFILKGDEIVKRIDGANAPDLTEAISKYAKVYSFKGAIPNNKPVVEESINDKLKRLTSMAPVVLFMKGTPSNPECGFSRQIISILNEQGVSYSTFNILTDEVVRQELKTFSQWPTYPQLWVTKDGKSDLIGGLDIVKELVETGEFLTVVPKPESLNSRLSKLINSSPVMIFIKGNPSVPKCGFSRQLISLLDELGISYSHFDILEDEEVRQGLKSYSNWPTYPQVYVKGELIGGLDIVKELHETGDLVSTLKC